MGLCSRPQLIPQRLDRGSSRLIDSGPEGILVGIPPTGPPGIPADRMVVLRKAFMGMTQKDKVVYFLKEGRWLTFSVGNPEGLGTLVTEFLASSDKEVVAEFNSIVEEN